jgi:hypothetical protein
MPPLLFPGLSLTMAAEEADGSVQRVVVVVEDFPLIRDHPPVEIKVLLGNSRRPSQTCICKLESARNYLNQR